MTDRAQFEAMLEALINDDTDQAKEIFHNIVVSKSREIYEELLAEDFSQDSGNPYGKKDDDEEEMDEAGEGEPEPEAPMEGEDDEEEPADDDSEGEDDAEDDMDMDMGDEEGEDNGDMEDRVMDLEDALEDLKAEFEQLLSQEDEEGSHDMDAIHGADDMGDMDAEMDEADMQPMLEYYKKVSVSHGDNGVNNKSAVAGKNDMGGTTANIAKSFSTTTGGTTGGLAKNTAGDLTSGLGHIHNRKDSNAGKTAFKKSEPGHGAEKAGKKETADNKQSMLKARK